MEEAGDEVGEVERHIVDIGIEDAGGGMLRKDVVIGNGSGDEGAVAFLEKERLTGAADADLAIALDTHRDDETVVFAQVAMEGFGDLHHADIKIGGVDDLDGLVGSVTIVGAVVGLDMEVEGLGSQRGMELTGTAVKTGSVVVVDAVGDVAGLLL